MSKTQNNETFIHFHWCLDEEEYVWVFMLILLSNGRPVSAHIVPIVKPFLKCHIYPFIRN